MTTDTPIEAICGHLRALTYRHVEWGEVSFRLDPIGQEAADLIERLAAERDEAVLAYNRHDTELRHCTQRIANQRNELTTANLRLARLEGTLRRIAEYDQSRSWTATKDNPEMHWEAYDGNFAKIAKAALENRDG